MKQISVELINVSKHYTGKILFQDITVTAESGQCLVITGKNGAGKSTLLKMIAALLRPTTGTISLSADGQLVNADERAECISMVSPEVILYGAMSGYENLNFLAQVRGVECNSEQLSQYLAMVGLANDQHQQVAAYSTGMRQRLKFAVLLAMQSPVWLLDEPSSNLDDEGKALVGKLIRDALRAKTTVIIATNEYWEAEYATQTIHLG